MSGHSHWATIRRKKEGNDAKRGSLFTKLAREIVIAAREGGGDPDSNIGLRVAIDKARSMGMPKDNIDRAVRRGAGTDKDGETFDEIMYEGYGPNGVAVLIDVLTDNRNRTVAALRHALSRQGGTLAEAGAVAWQFERKGTIAVPAAVGFDRLFEAAVEAGAEDVIEGDEELEVRTAPADLKIVHDALRGQGIEISSMDLVMTPKNSMSLEPRDAAQVLKLVDFLEEMDDVRRVFTNLDVTEEAVAAFEAMA